MGNMDGGLGNGTPTTSLHQLYWWKNPRWIVVRIEALAMVAIIINFLLVLFGSCRRWSNSWIVQKGFFAAQVLSLSLGTYSIGLMQSSSVKSEMYPIWTVSMFTLFGCIDPVTTYNGLDYKGPLSKVVYGICLNCGYVLLMSISTISSVIGNAAIITLSSITVIKGFHMSFALVQQSKMRDMVIDYDVSSAETHIFRKDKLTKHWKDGYLDTGIRMAVIEESFRNHPDKRLQSCYDVCVALYLSQRMQRYFLGLDDYRVPGGGNLKDIDYEWALKVIEIELAFVYDALFTGNPFLHYYQAKTASLWALASFTGICFVLVATAIPGGMPRRSAASGCTKVVDTTATDLAFTFGILVSLALLQLTQLVRSWTSNWARAAVACVLARRRKDIFRGVSRWMRLKVAMATRSNLFDKYLWQDKISQHWILPEPRLLTGRERKYEWMSSSKKEGEQGRWIRVANLVKMLGLDYIWDVIWELLGFDTNKRGGVKLDEDVKGPVIHFLGQIHSSTLDRNWLSSIPEEEPIRYFLPHYIDLHLLKTDNPRVLNDRKEPCYRYASCVITWHIVTWYCELEEQRRQEEEDALTSKQEEAPISSGREIAGEAGAAGNARDRDHRRVANALSQYCVYLVKSAPELLPGPVAWTKHVYNRFAQEAKETRINESSDKDAILANLPEPDSIFCADWFAKHGPENSYTPDYGTQNGGALAKLLMRGRDEMWKMLELVWVQLLVYAAPYGNAEAHMRRLSQGGEFITHLWTLLYHLDIRKWKVQQNLAEISTQEDAERVLNEDQAVVAYLRDSQDDPDFDELATASRLEDGVRYYYTSNFDPARLFSTESNKRLVLLKKESYNHKLTFYDGRFCAYDIARFVTANKIHLNSKDDGGQSRTRLKWIENEIEEEDGGGPSRTGLKWTDDEIEEVF